MNTEQKQALIKAYTKAINEADEIDGMGFTDIYEINPVNGWKRLESGTTYHILILQKNIESTGKAVTTHIKKIDKLRKIMYR